MQTATSETESKSLDPSICVHHYTLRAPCPKGQGIAFVFHALAPPVHARPPLPYRRGHGSSDSCCFSQSCATSCRLWTLLSSSPWTRPRTARLPPTRPSETDLPPARLLGLLLRRVHQLDMCLLLEERLRGSQSPPPPPPPPPPPSDSSSDSSSSSPASDR